MITLLTCRQAMISVGGRVAWDRYQRNLRRLPRTKWSRKDFRKARRMDNKLLYAFPWDYSHEGRMYWLRIYQKLVAL